MQRYGNLMVIEFHSCRHSQKWWFMSKLQQKSRQIYKNIFLKETIQEFIKSNETSWNIGRGSNQFRFTTQSLKLFGMNFHSIMKCYPALVEGWRNLRKGMRKRESCGFSWDWMIVMLPFMEKSYWCNLHPIHIEFTHLSFNKDEHSLSSKGLDA